MERSSTAGFRFKTVLIGVATFAVVLAALDCCAAASGGPCIVSYGPVAGTESDSCAYVASGSGTYVVNLMGGRFEVVVDGREVVSTGDSSVGIFFARPGDTVDVEIRCDLGVYCTAEGAVGVAVVSDEPVENAGFGIPLSIRWPWFRRAP
jgi:hypothetical protein